MILIFQYDLDNILTSACSFAQTKLNIYWKIYPYIGRKSIGFILIWNKEEFYEMLIVLQIFCTRQLGNANRMKMTDFQPGWDPL